MGVPLTRYLINDIMLFWQNHLQKTTNVSGNLRRFFFLIVLLFLFCFEGFSQDNYTSKASGDWTNSSTWTPPHWLPNSIPNNSQSVTIAAGHTVTYNGDLSYSQNITIDGTLIVTGSFTHSNFLTISSTGSLIVGENISTNGFSISGKLKAGGNYSSSGGTNTIAPSGIMIIEGDAQSHVGFSIQGKLLVSGNYTVTGGTLSVDGNGMMVVGKNLQNGNMIVNVNDSGRLLVMGNLITNTINKATSAQIAVLGDLVIGTWNHILENLGCTSYCKQSLNCTECQILDIIDPTHPDWTLSEGITAFWWEDFNSNTIGDTTEGTKWAANISNVSVKQVNSTNTLYFNNNGSSGSVTLWQTQEINIQCYKNVSISGYTYNESIGNTSINNLYYRIKSTAGSSWSSWTALSNTNGYNLVTGLNGYSIQVKWDVNTNKSCWLDNIGVSGTATCGGSSTVPLTPGEITGSQTVCSSTSDLIYSISPVSNATSYQWQVPAGWSITQGDGTTTITVTSGTSGGTVTVTAVNSNGSSNPQTKLITVTAVNTVSSASTTPTLCINSALSPITHTTTGATGIGTAAGLPTGVTASWSSNTITISGTPATSGTFNYSIPLAGGCGTVNATGTITVNALPTAATVGPTQNICGSLLSGALGGNTPVDGTGSWNIVSGGTGSFSSVASGNSTFTANSYGTYKLRWTISNGSCTSSTADITVNFYETPTTANAGVDQFNCNNSTFTLAGNAPYKGTGAWSLVSGTATITNSSSPTSTVTGLATGSSATLRWTITNGTCSSTDDVVLTNYATPTTASAGTDQSNCNNGTFTLAGNAPTTGTGLWSIVSGSATITNPSSPTSTITGIASGSNVTLQWTITNGICNLADDVVLTNYATPTTASAGVDQFNCNNSTFTLVGNTPSTGTGSWSLVSGSATITNPSSPTATVTGVAAGSSATLRWTIANGTCISNDDVVLTNYATPTTANAGVDQSNCNNGTFTLAGNMPSTGTGSWSLVSGSATITSPSATTSTVTGIAAGTSATLRWTITNGTCSSTDDVVLTNYATPTTANAGVDQSNCNNNAFTLAGNNPSIGTGSWSLVSGSATITSPLSPTSTVTGIAAGTSATLRWTITNGTCISTDDVVLTNYATPTTANAGVDQSNCNNNTFTLAGNNPSIGTGSWWLVSGSATITSPLSPTSTVTGIAAGTSATLRWTITNGTCISTDDVTLTNNALPTAATVGLTQNICSILVSNALGGNTPLVGIGSWNIVSGGTGTFSAPTSGNSTFTANAYGTYVLRWTISNGNCTPSTADITVNYYATPTTASIATTKINYIGVLTTNILGGNTPVIGNGAWSIASGGNGTFSSQTNGNATFTTGATGTYVLRWTITNGTCSNFAEVTIHFYDVTSWNGTVSSDWAAALNWTPNEVPDGSTGILIPATANDPVISGTSPTNDVSISGNLKIQDGATLTLEAGPVLTLNSGANATTTGNGSKIIIQSDASYLNLSTSSPTLKMERSLTGTKGWRMVSSPVSTTYSDMFKAPLVTQGFTGSTYLAKQPNLLLWDETDGGTSLQSWRNPSSFASAIPEGKGHFHYIFNGAGITEGGTYPDVLPQTMTVTGNENGIGGHSFSLTYTDRNLSDQTSTNYVDKNIADQGWNLEGNPTASTLDWDIASGWNKTNIDNTIYVWDPSANGGNGDYLTWNGTSGTLGSGRIAPFQAFWVHANTSSPALSFSNLAKTAVNGTFLKTASIDNSVRIPLTLSGEGMETTSFISLSDNGITGPDSWDGYRLEPMSESWLALYMKSSLSYNEPLVINNLPATVENAYIPLFVNAQKEGQKVGGTFTLQWKVPANWPGGLTLQLMDHTQKKAISMLQFSEYKFEQAATKSAGIEAINPLNVPTQLVKYNNEDAKLKTTESLPFSIVISRDNSEIVYQDKVPVLFTNYPNPFSENTTIKFSLPDTAPVQIDIFDIYGRLLETPFKGTLPSGLHYINWPPNIKVSGVLIIRMTTSKTVLAVKALKKQ
jgi:hypothetical protein